MTLFTLALQRIVPLLLWYSLVLVCGRLVFDHVRGRASRVAAPLFATLLLAGGSVSASHVVRSVTLVRAAAAFDGSSWRDASDLFSDYGAQGGRVSRLLGYQHGLALMNQRRWTEAETALLATVARTANRKVEAWPRTVFALGLCRYYRGELEAAERTLRAVPGAEFDGQRVYFLGRIAEARGDLERAGNEYERSASIDPRFYPALYHLVRVRLSQRREERALSTLTTVLRRAGIPADDPGITRLVAACRHAAPPPGPREFFLVRTD